MPAAGCTARPEHGQARAPAMLTVAPAAQPPVPDWGAAIRSMAARAAGAR
jgi:hypothetical protein